MFLKGQKQVTLGTVGWPHFCIGKSHWTCFSVLFPRESVNITRLVLMASSKCIPHSANIDWFLRFMRDERKPRTVSIFYFLNVSPQEINNRKGNKTRNIFPQIIQKTKPFPRHAPQWAPLWGWMGLRSLCVTVLFSGRGIRGLWKLACCLITELTLRQAFLHLHLSICFLAFLLEASPLNTEHYIYI